MDAAYVPHGRAVLDHWRGSRDAVLVLHCEGHATDEVSAAVYFRAVEDFDELEREALGRCRGRVLDVGAGAGAFALPLQQRGHEVVAIDVARACVTVMRERGVRDARCAVTSDVADGPFDTVLMMMHGVGIVGTLDGLSTCLADLHRLVVPGGCVLLDSAPAETDAPRGGGGETSGDAPAEDPAVEDRASPEAGLPGTVDECRYVLEYDGVRGAPLDWLFVDAGTLTERARDVGWCTTILTTDAVGRYLARLSRLA